MVYDGQFSPNERWVAYTSREFGRDEICVVPFDPVKALNASAGDGGGRKWRISTAGGRFAKWRPDGKEIFWISPVSEIMAADIRESKDGIEVGVPHALFSSEISAAAAPYDVTPDGKRFVINIPSRRGGPLTLVVNWTASLKNR
jgi:hypothetical protein